MVQNVKDSSIVNKVDGDAMDDQVQPEDFEDDQVNVGLDGDSMNQIQ